LLETAGVHSSLRRKICTAQDGEGDDILSIPPIMLQQDPRVGQSIPSTLRGLTGPVKAQGLPIQETAAGMSC
jgi:hypothetical protein